ncbi:LysR family transcriptional regulator [Mycobacterium avium]|uniref:LysR family transcriptional regulator n=1 Tax=Mycobacterium avium TaxID=1764 RepID=UPI000310F1E3|nr:LysR family transcriptional regulator [Mycobacterium avium]MDV3264062.1 LysR family transcriptional regulator [Mycobacterium avium]UEA21702.1 LysR family transcriptional regulator [Mycobacterium avium subsp. avium]UEA36091.1 LysR family transcriptional regulator [Mycobacterium avium subsp. avium]UGU09886.1 LysR family transcriptional regulator [Mycobacterium avium subsp. avium]UGU19875.1 LysR family transcriptional regulator [Mycobacterium avium subsp. avium]
MTTLSQLKTFIAVVDQGGFTAASRRLGLSQPAVSRTVATLEKNWGCRCSCAAGMASR